jgi:exopolysaccharide biosynthesis polyprenyl glycosylphosphotransferase
LIFPAISATGAFKYATLGWFWLTIVPTMVALRAVLRSLTSSNLVPVQDILIIGSGPRALSLYERLTGVPDHRRIVGFVDTVSDSTPASIRDKVLGPLESLEGLLMHRAIDEVLIALPMKSCYSEIQEVIRVCERVGVRSKYLADIFELRRSARNTPETRSGVVDVPIASDDYRLLIKRVIDVIGALVALLLLSPVLLAAAAAVKLTSRGPLIFRQERYGYNRRKFAMLKFRTMVANAEALQAQFETQNEAAGPIFKIRDDPRMTPVGRFLRRASIDELPQLINVLRGEMSLVGPRPMATRDVHRFTEAALMRRFSVRPGITCLWQVSGRSNLGFDRWIELDLQYIDQWSLALDASILARTVPAVMKGTGAA